jgi:hypothetical protein
MSASFRQLGPGRLQIREGGGTMAVFGLPFFAAGVFTLLGGLGIVRLSGNASPLARPVLGLMGLVFATVGGTLVFGRKWTTLDTVQRRLIRQWGALVPLHERGTTLDDYSTVTIGFVRGDSDSADTFPVALRDRAGTEIKLFAPARYAEARSCAMAIAQHLQVGLEDRTTDHPTRQSFDQLDRSFQSRARRPGLVEPLVPRPAGAQSTIARDQDLLRIQIPAPRLNALALALALAPLTIPVLFGPGLATFFARAHPPDAASRVFIGLFVFGFAVVPVLVCLNTLARSWRSRTMLSITTDGIEIRERGAWRTNLVASIAAADIVDVDYSTRESTADAARRAAGQQSAAARGASAATSVGPPAERVMRLLAGLARGRGIIVKTTRGLTTVGAGLGDDEVRYLCSVIRRALLGAPVDPDAFA